jgi:hypothetical protein
MSRDVAGHFKNLALETVDSPASSPRTIDGINFLEKVDAWMIGDPEEGNPSTILDDFKRDIDSSFGGVDVEEVLPEISTYRKLIEQSRAYMWLLAQLRRKTRLSTPGIDVRMALRKSVLGCLSEPPGISRRGFTELISAVYDVHWDVLEFLNGQLYKEPEHGLENVVTLTGSADQAQAETCIRYVEQIWPSMGRCLLRALKCAVQAAEGTLHTCT